jgi:hypothetical protein
MNMPTRSLDADCWRVATPPRIAPALAGGTKEMVSPHPTTPAPMGGVDACVILPSMGGVMAQHQRAGYCDCGFVDGGIGEGNKRTGIACVKRWRRTRTPPALYRDSTDAARASPHRLAAAGLRDRPHCPPTDRGPPWKLALYDIMWDTARQ